MKSLVIVESPSKAKKIQEYLGKNYIVLATQGHIVDLGKGGKHGIGVDIENNFNPKYVLMEDKCKIMDSLIDAAESSDQIFIASDPDREGEAIAWHVASRLYGCDKPLKRVEFNEITKKGIQKGISSPREIDINLFKAQETRRILDRIVGFMVSPFLISNIGPKLSAGRVQSVVTKMIIDRELEIQSFHPEEYWNIKVNLKNKLSSESFWAKVDLKVNNKSDADKLKEDLVSKNSIYEVTSVESNVEKKKQPPPMITSELQRIMSRSFGFSPEKTMKSAQSLYEGGYVTYIRTDSVRIEDDALKNVRSWLQSSGYSIPKSPVIHKSKSEAQDAHECIRPTDILLGPDNSELLGDEKKVYEIIWKYFVASQMEPAIYDTLKVNIRVKNTNCILKATGRALKSKGFLDVMGIGGDEKIDIPTLSKGDVLELSSQDSVICERKFTQPPQRFSADTLIKSMEQKNIGRPATYAEVISKITNRNYVELDGKYFKPTELGNKVNSILEKFFSFMDYNYTVDMEKKLDKIADGSVDSINALNDFFSSFNLELRQAYLSNGNKLCDLCGSHMVERVSKSGSHFLGCSKFPKCKFIFNVNDKN